MKAVSFRCDGCGADLKLRPGTKKCVCEYCGTEHIIDDGQVYGQEGTADPELIKTIRMLIEPVSELDNLCKNTERIKKKLQESIKREKSLREAPYTTASIAGGITAVVIMILLFFVLTIFSIPVGIIIGLIVFACVYFSQKSEQERLAINIPKLTSQIESNEKEIQYYREILEKYDVSFIPMQYRNRDAMTFFCEVMETNRATSLQQAMNLYEDELHRREQRAMAQRQIDLQEEQIRLQKKQIEQMKNMHDDYDDDDVMTKAVTAGALAVGGALLANKTLNKAAKKTAKKAAGTAVKEIIKRM
ncbi:MAG: hypothetical protein IJM23_08070 [Lachnospiraceae bacterium]|nr:hypothetical protein [Lachnospiraceae bacterium]